MVCHTDLYKALNRQPDNISELLRIYNGDDVMIVLYQLPQQRFMVVAIGLCNSDQCVVSEHWHALQL